MMYHAENHYQFQLQYHDIIDKLITTGVKENGRNGDFLRLTEPVTFKIGGSRYIPLLTTRKMNPECWITEFCWDWNGRTKVEELGKYAYLWDKWANESGRLPFSYGRIWRNPFYHPFDETKETVTRESNYDQIASVVNELVKSKVENYTSRRAVINTWDPSLAITTYDQSAPSVVPPCHPLLIFQTHKHGETRKSISLHVTARSQDMLVGFPGDVMRYAMLLRCIVAAVNNQYRYLHSGQEEDNQLDYIIGSLTFNIVDCHIYSEHVEKYRQSEDLVFQRRVTIGSLTPKLAIEDEELIYHDTFLKPERFEVLDYFPVNNAVKYGLIACRQNSRHSSTDRIELVKQRKSTTP